MRTISKIFIKNPVAELAAGRVRWGEVIAESYWKIDKSGGLVMSAPDISEIINGIFWPLLPTLKDSDVVLNNWITGFKVEEVPAADYKIDRLVFKPDPHNGPPAWEEVRREILNNFNEHWPRLK